MHSVRRLRSRRVLAENIAALTVLQAVIYAGPLFTVPYLVRVLQPASYGLLTFAQAVVLYCDYVTDYGFALTATREISVHRDSPKEISRMFWITICSKAALMAGTGLVLAALVLTVPNVRQVSSIYMACFLSVVGSCVFPAWLFLGLECVKPSAIAMGAARLLTVPLLLVFVRQPEHYIRAAAIQSSVELTATLLIIPYLVKRVRLRWYRPSLPEIVASLRTGWPLFMSGSVLLLCNSSAAVILGITAGKEQVGYYAAAEKLVKAAIAAISPAAQALYPHISGAKVESKGVALRLIRNSFWSIGGLALVVSIATFVCARPVSMLVLGAAFAPSVRLLQFMSPLPFLFAVMSVLGTQTMVVFEMDRLMSRIMIGAACGGIPLTFLLTLYLGAVGTANAAVLVAMVIVTAMIVSLRRKRLAIWRSPCASECLPAGSS